MTKAVAKKASNEVAFPSELFEDSQTFGDNLDKEDFLIPRLQVAQSVSPQVKESKPEYIEGCKEGSVFNSATEELIEVPAKVLSCAYKRLYIEWVPREKGGGLINTDHDESILDKCTQGDDFQYTLPNGNEIVITPEHYILLLREGQFPVHMVMSMSGSKARVSRQWNTMIQSTQLRHPETGQAFTPPRFYGVYEVATCLTTNARNEEFWNWKIRQDGSVFDLEDGSSIYEMAKKFYQLVNEGKVKVEPEQAAPKEQAEEVF